jgi:lipopolysaccharide/colanic/teichoic acid biosynthesis glycosyltransferase
MSQRTTLESIALLVGDILILIASLWLSLALRRFEIPESATLILHFVPFIVVFSIATLIFYIAGLYERNALYMSSRVPAALFFAQIAHAICAILLFYFVPQFGIYPKVSLFIYVGISTLLLFIWRMYGATHIAIGVKQSVMIIGRHPQITELREIFDTHPSYKINVVEAIDVETCSMEHLVEALRSAVQDKHCTSIIVDVADVRLGEALSATYDFLLSNTSIYDINQIYEQVFKRVSAHSVHYGWITETNKRSYVLYDLCKRVIDLSVAIPLALVTFPFFPLVALAIRLESKGKVFITQERVGKKDAIIHMYKFRSMARSDAGVWLKDAQNTNTVTKVGYILRKSRIDELPQLINVIRGDISLIGPRPDIVGLGQKLMTEIPFYMTRYSVLPGLSGWAQIHQGPPQSVEETKLRFAFDLYYVKHRSILLDIKIALRTVYELLSRNGM